MVGNLFDIIRAYKRAHQIFIVSCNGDLVKITLIFFTHKHHATHMTAKDKKNCQSTLLTVNYRPRHPINSKLPSTGHDHKLCSLMYL